MVGLKRKNLFTVLTYWCTLSTAALSSSCSDGKIKAEVDAKIEVIPPPNPTNRIGNRTIKPFPDSFPTTAGLFVFKPASDLDLDTVEGYVIGFPDTLKVEATTEDRFFINNVPPGEHEVFLRAKRKDGNDVAVILGGLKSLSGTKTELDASKLANSPGKDLAFYVKSTENNGISDVSFEIGGTNFKAQSGADGLVKFSFLPAGKFDLLAQKNGFRSGIWRRVTVDSIEKEIRLIRRVNSGAALKISGGETTVFSVKNIVTVSPPDLPPAEMPDEMLVSSHPDFSDASWEPLRSSFVWRFNAQGAQRLYVKFRKSTGSASNNSVLLNTPIAAETMFDAFFNDAVITVNGGNSTSSSRTFQIQLTAPLEAVSMILSENNPTSSDIWQPIFQSKSFTASGVGERILSFKFRDADGFESQVFTAMVMIDNIPPNSPVLAMPNMSDGFINIEENANGFPLVITGEANSDYKVVCSTNCKVVSNSGLKSEHLGKLSASGSATVSLKANTSGLFSATVILADEAQNISTGSTAAGIADLDRPFVLILTQGYSELEFDEFLPLKLIASDAGPSGIQSISGDSDLITIESADAVNCKKAIRDKSSAEKFALLTECSPGHFRVRVGANFVLDNAGNTSQVSLQSSEIFVKQRPANKMMIGDWHTTRYNLKADNTLWGWGKTRICIISNGEQCFQLLGASFSNLIQDIPVRIGQSGTWKSLCPGPSQTFAIHVDGTLWGWGMNDAFGVLGTSDLTSSVEPRLIDTDTSWVNCETNGKTSYAIKSDGTIWGWGSNSYGQLGNITSDFFATPTKLNNHTWLAVKTFNNGGALLLNADGSIWLFGYSGSSEKSLPNKISEDSWRKIAAKDRGLAFKSDGTLWRVRPGFSPILQKIGTATTWDSGSGSVGNDEFTSAVKVDGSLWVWNNSNADTPTQMGSGFVWKNAQVVGGGGGNTYRITFALRSDDTLWAFGDSTSVSLFLGKIGASSDATFSLHQLDASSNWTAVRTAGQHTLALKENGSLWAWGRNSCGQVGNGTTTNALVPIQIGSDSDWFKIDTSKDHSVAIKADGTLWAWGCNAKGQLGVGSTVNALSPIQVGTGSTWVEVSAGAGFTVARKADGTLWAWGDNEFGVVGNGLSGTGLFVETPSQILSDTDWKMVFASKHSSSAFATQVDKKLFSWGDNRLGGGLLGRTGSVAGGAYFPLLVNTAADWIQISSSGNGNPFTLAIKTNGELWGWGDNYGALTSLIEQGRIYSPIQIGADSNWTRVSAGTSHAIAIKSDKTLWGWGNNNTYGPLGARLGIADVQNMINTDNDWKDIAAGDGTTFAIKENGTLWGAGRREFLGMDNSSLRTWLQFPTEYE